MATITEINQSIPTAMKTADWQIEFVMSNLTHLRKARGAAKMEDAVENFRAIRKAGRNLSGPQLSYLDSIYEKCFAGAGFPSANVHHSKRKRGLKFGGA